MVDIGFILLITFFLFIQGFLANSEMAVVSANRFKMRYLANNGNERARIITVLLNNPDKLFGTTLLGTNLSTILASFFADIYFHKYVTGYFPFITNFISMEILVLLVMEPLILVFAELFPMSLARKYYTETALKNAKNVRIFYYFLFPFMYIPTLIPKFLKFILKNKSVHPGISREELELLVTGSYANIPSETQKYIKDLFETNTLVAEDIMVYLNEVIACEENDNVGRLKTIIEKSGFTRIPVYKQDIFNIIGTVHVVNILGADDKEKVSEYTDKLYIVPTTKPIFQILSEFKTNRKYMAIVVNEYGAVSGIITLADILREIFGGLIHGKKESTDKREYRPKDQFIAEMELVDFFEKTGIDFQEPEVETLGGIINLALGRIGRINEEVEYKGVKFKILDATDKVVKKIKLLEIKQKDEKKENDKS